MQADITLLSTVDAVTAEIAGTEEKLDLLFMSPGYMKLSGRDGPTPKPYFPSILG